MDSEPVPQRGDLLYHLLPRLFGGGIAGLRQALHALVDLLATDERASINLLAGAHFAHVLLVGAVDCLQLTDLPLQGLHLVLQHQNVRLLAVLAHVPIEFVGHLDERSTPSDRPFRVYLVLEFARLARFPFTLQFLERLVALRFVIYELGTPV